jgi:hypothetical protein
MRVVACAALIAASMIVAAPASAAKYLITVQGSTFAFAGAPGTTPIPEVAALGGQSIFAAFEVDSANASFTQGGILVGGSVSLLRNVSDAGNIFLVDNGGNPSNPNARQDQATISSGARVINGVLVQNYALSGLPGDIFLNSLAFGRTRVGDINNLPTLVTDVTQRPDFPSFLFAPGGTNPFMSLQFRRGNPTSPTQIAGLPVHSLSVTNLTFQVQELTGVPEPSSWAMLIAGFGLTGAAMRRRRGQVAA